MKEEPLRACSRTITFEMTSDAGFGSEINNLIFVGIYAYITNRTLLIDSKIWNYGNWSSWFVNPTKNCSSASEYLAAYQETACFFPKDEDSPHLKTNRMWGSLYQTVARYPHIYLNVFAQRAMAAHHLRINSQTKERIKEFLMKNFGSDNPLNYFLKKQIFYGLHIRRGDKMPIAKANPIIKYVEALENLIVNESKDKTLLSSPIDNLIVFVSSDDLKFVIPELQKLRSTWKLIYRKSAPISELPGHFQSHFNQLNETVRTAQTLELLVDIESLRHAKYVMCLYSSNFCRLVQALRNQDPETIVGIDKTWFSGIASDIIMAAGRLRM